MSARRRRHRLTPRDVIFVLLFALAVHSPTNAHPLAPGLLALTETAPNQFQGIWKLPNKTIERGQLSPIFPAPCEIADLQPPVSVGTGRSQSFRLHCQQPLLGQSIGIDGIAPNGSGVLVRINFSDGQVVHQMLNSQADELLIPEQQTASGVFSRYLTLGVEHLVLGYDHVLFVITLALLVGWGKQLIWTITLFTVGHSITLSLTALGFISMPIGLIESIIALSIAWAAAEVIQQESDGLLQRRPWLMSGGFGFLHGMGFASALAAIGLPQQALTISLAAFNVGIELGQLLIIGLFFAVAALIHRVAGQVPAVVKTLSCYAIGCTGAYWFWQRLLGL